jgi:hypothetical protein
MEESKLKESELKESELKESELKEPELKESKPETKKEKLKKKIKEEMPPEYKNVVPDFMIDLVISTMSDESIPDDVDNPPSESNVVNEYANYTFPKVPGIEVLALEPTALKILARTVHQFDDEELSNNIKEMFHNKIKLSIANSKLNISKANRELKMVTGGGDYFDEEDCTFFR